MIYRYEQLAYAIINQAVYDYYYYRHKRGREEVIKRMIEKHQEKKPPFQTEEYYAWRGEMQKLTHRLYRVHDADNQLLEVKESMLYGEIATLCDLLGLVSGAELYKAICNQKTRPAKFMRKMNDAK